MLKSLISYNWYEIIETRHIGENVNRVCYNEIYNDEKEIDLMNPDLMELSVRLAEVGAKNTASAIGNKLKAAKQGRDDRKTIVEMNDLIYELLDEKQELESIAKAYQEEFVSQKLSADDFEFISKTVIPVLKDFLQKVADSEDEQSAALTKKSIESIDAFESLLSINTLNVLQLIGFNFKKGIGEPLTELISKTIDGKNKESQLKLNELIAERDTEYFKLMQNEGAFNRFMSTK